MVATPPTSDHLRSLIGHAVEFRGRELRIVEVLEDGPSLVLEQAQGARAIHGNQYGEAGRRSPDTWTLPIFGSDGITVNPLIVELGLDDLIDS